jgi:hypothetical protein
MFNEGPDECEQRSENGANEEGEIGRWCESRLWSHMFERSRIPVTNYLRSLLDVRRDSEYTDQSQRIRRGL